LVEDVVTIDDVLEEALDEAMEDELNEVQATVMLTPIKRLEVSQQAETAILKPVTAILKPVTAILKPVTAILKPVTAILKPVTVSVLNPVKKRGVPPSSAPGSKPGQVPEKEATAVLNPIRKLNPVRSPEITLDIAPSDKDE
jgi:hypothetical protein